MKHIWEVKHPYYCNEGNYFTSSRDVHDNYKSWPEFEREYQDSDFDLNLVFRFDWRESEESPFNGDEHYRNGELLIFWMGQRKGIYRWSSIEVCRADEPSVLEFLKPRWEHLKKLWEPFA